MVVNIIIGGSILFVPILTVTVVQMKKEKKEIEIGRYQKNSILIEEFKRNLNFLFGIFKNEKTFLKDIEIVEVTRYLNYYNILFKYKNVSSVIQHFDNKEQTRYVNVYYLVAKLERKIEDINRQMRKRWIGKM